MRYKIFRLSDLEKQATLISAAVYIAKMARCNSRSVWTTQFHTFEALLHGLLLILQNIISKLSKQIFKSFQNTTATFVRSKFLNDKWASNDLSRLTTNSTTGRFISSFTFFYYFVNYTLMPGFGVIRDWKRSGYWPPQNPAQFILLSFKYLLWLLSKLCFVRSGDSTVLMPQKS